MRLWIGWLDFYCTMRKIGEGICEERRWALQGLWVAKAAPGIRHSGSCPRNLHLQSFLIPLHSTCLSESELITTTNHLHWIITSHDFFIRAGAIRPAEL